MNSTVKKKLKKLFAIYWDMKREKDRRVKGDTFCNMLDEILQIKEVSEGVYRHVRYVAPNIDREKITIDEKNQLCVCDTYGRTYFYQKYIMPR